MKHRVLTEGCEWILDGKTFNTDELLDTYIEKQIQNGTYRLDSGTLRIMQSVDLKARAKRIIDSISDEISGVARLVTPGDSRNVTLDDNAEEAESYYVIDDSIGVNRFLREVSRPGLNKSYVQPFDVQAWREYTFKKLVSPEYGKTAEEANKIIEGLEATWPELTKLGTEIHKIFENTFNGELAVKPSNSILTDAQFRNVVSQAEELKKDILKKYPNADIYTELGIISKELSEDIAKALKERGFNSINGKIDLLVIDQQGNAHIYDFKVSRKEVGEWNTEVTDKRPDDVWDIGKIEGASYQLAFYAAILRQWGISVRDTSVIPVKLDLIYKDAENKIGVDSVENVSIVTDGKTERLPNIISGKYAIQTNQVIKQQMEVSSDEIINVMKIFNGFFPKNTTLQRIEDVRSNVEHYKNNPKYVTPLRPGDYKYDSGARYRIKYWGIPGNAVDWANNEQELTEKLTAFVQKLGSAKGEFCLDFGHKLQDVFAGNLLAERISDNIPDSKKSWVEDRFKRYFDEGWSLDSNEDCIADGFLVFSLGNKSEIVILERNPLHTVISLGLGKSLLGKNTDDKYVDKLKTLPSTNGNLALMKAMIYVSQHPNYFQGKRISEISAVNLEKGEEVTALPSMLISNYNTLCDKNRSVGAAKVNSTLFFTDLEACVQNAESRLLALNEDLFGHINPDDAKSRIDYLDNLIYALRNKYKTLYRTRDDKNITFETPEWQAFHYLNEARLALSGNFTSYEQDEQNWINKGIKLNGYNLISPQFASSANLRQVGSLLQNYESDIARAVYEAGWGMEQLFIKLYDENGNGTQVFKNWYVRKADGSLDERLILKDPDGPQFNGSQTEKEALRMFLKIINELKRPNITESEIESLKLSGEYYEVPLTEAVWSRQVRGNIRDVGLVKGFIKTIRDKWRQAKTLTQNVFAEDELDAVEYNNQGKELYNKFRLEGDARQQKINDHGVGFFETNLEVIFNQALVAFKREQIGKQYIPKIQAMRLGIMYAQDHGGVNNPKMLEAFDKIIKSKFYGESIIEDETMRNIYAFLSMVRSIFTTMTLSINIPSFLRESLQGIYTGNSRAIMELFPNIDFKTYARALEYVVQKSHKNISSVSLLQQINAVYQMANQSVNQIANQRRVNWLNIKNWSRDTLFLTATAPDFMHRMSIMVAKMMADGCWEAHELVDGKLVYNFKKDARFKEYLANNISHKDYLKQKALYETMIEEFNKSGYTKEDGTQLKVGDDLPRAYTNIEAQGIKNYADLLYGHYDESSKALVNDMFIGSFMLQYKTYITAKFEQWTMPKGIYNTATLQQQFDPETGEELYIVLSEDEDGSVHKDVFRRSEVSQEDIDTGKARIYYDYNGIPMEGLFQEMMHFGKSLAKLDFKEFKKLWDNPNDRKFLLLGLHDQFLMAMLMFFITFMFGSEMEDVKNPWDPVEVGRKVREMGPAAQIAFNVLQGSTIDAQFIGLARGNQGIVQSMAANPPLLMAVKRFGTTNWKMIQGKQSFAYTASQNIGAIRTLQGTIKQLSEDD